MKVVIAAGGTAGHVNPALALAAAMERDEVTFVGTRAGVEARLVPRAGFPFETIEVGGFDRSRPASLVPVGLRALRAVVAASRLLSRVAPDVVVGMGGYVSLPVCLAAARRRIPVVVHEQNIVLGLANKICRRVARKVAVSFEETLARVGSRGVLVGNPVQPEWVGFDRDEIRKAGLANFDLDPARKSILVFGGSLGAQRVNRAAVEMIDLWKDRGDLQVVHILGSARGREDLKDPIGTGALIYRAFGFVERMVEAYAVADLAVCRGGATTLAELCCAGVPAIVVPYPWHRDRQQELQARALERAGAARVVPDPDASGEMLASVAEELLADEQRLAEMRAAARACARPDAAARLAEIVREVA